LHTLDELLMLNLDVITHVITWFITLIADHEHVKRELRDEVAENKDNLQEYLAKTDTHLHRCFVESMRVRPFAGKSFSTSPLYSESIIFRAGLGELCAPIMKADRMFYSFHNWGILILRQELSRCSGKTQCEWAGAGLPEVCIYKHADTHQKHI
jgi:hypothetical protein